MTKKYITPAGKTKLLQKAFVDGTNAFKYMALGDGNGAISEDITNFKELAGHNYRRVVTTCSEGDQSVTIHGVFEGNNYNPSDGGDVKEIAITDSSEINSGSIFAVIEVPNIVKNNNISLKYSVVITLL